MARLYGVADGRARSRTTAAHRLRTRGYRRSDAVPTRRRVAVDARVAGIAVEPAGDRAAERVHDAAGRRRPRLLRSAGAVEAHERRLILPGARSPWRRPRAQHPKPSAPPPAQRSRWSSSVKRGLKALSSSLRPPVSRELLS